MSTPAASGRTNLYKPFLHSVIGPGSQELFKGGSSLNRGRVIQDVAYEFRRNYLTKLFGKAEWVPK